MSIRRFALATLASALLTTLVAGPVAAATELLNVSYDPTRELYQEYNAAFIKHWKAQGGDDLKVQQSHGGSGKQARAVIDGLKADVVTLALAGDIDELQKLGKLIPENWQARLPDNSTPTLDHRVPGTQGQPQGHQGLGRPDQGRRGSHHPEPEDLRRRRWNFLAAWAWAKKQYGSDAKAQEYVQALYKHVPVLDTGARGSTITFVNNNIGDVLLAWENEAFLALKEQGGENFEIIAPSLSILAEPPVSVVDKNVDKKGTRKVAEAYLQYLYSEEGQRIAAKNFYRPRDAKVAAEFAKQFPKLDLVTVDKDFNGWKEAQPKFFNDGGIFDQIYQAQ